MIDALLANTRALGSSGGDTRFDVAALLSAERCETIEIVPEHEPARLADHLRFDESLAESLLAAVLPHDGIPRDPAPASVIRRA